MDEKNKQQGSRVFKIECPCCRSVLWIDAFQKEVIKFEKKARRKGDLDDLLLKEKERKAKFDERFESTAELAKEKQKEAQRRYREAFIRMQKKGDKD